MQLLLGSGGFSGENRKEQLVAAMRDFFGDIQKILFVPYAGHDHEGYVKRMHEVGFDAGYELVGIHRFEDQQKAVKDCDGIYVGGGNSFRLVDELHRHGLVTTIRDAVRSGLPYMGVSAGTNVACPTMQTTNDMPILEPSSFESMGLVPFQINAHYYPGKLWFQRDNEYQPHFGESRQDRIREFHECQATPVVGLEEGGILRQNGEQWHLSLARAFLFLPGQTEEELPQGVDIASRLCR